MRRPICIDLYSCGSGSGEGYHRAGYDTYAIDNVAKALEVNPFPHACMDALEAVVLWLDGQGVTFSNGVTLHLKDIALIHASPPCQGYSIMNNLPWIRKRVYPLEIVACRELLTLTGKPYVIENVAGAASKKNLEKLGLLEHRLRAFWLCGGMFGLPIYRHRYFETNFFWPMPGHPKHLKTLPRYDAMRKTDATANWDGKNPVNSGWRAGHDGQGALAVADVYGAGSTPGQRGIHGAHDGDRRRRPHLTERAIGTNGQDHAGHSPMPKGKASLPEGNGAQAVGAAVGHAAGWRIAAEAMGIDWMRRSELTQAIPPVMTEYIGRWSPAILGVLS